MNKQAPAPPKPDNPLRDLTFVAARMDTSVKTVRRLIAREAIPSHRIGRLIRVADTDLENYIQAQRVVRQSTQPS